MEAYMWLILASMLAVGILLGFFMGRSKGDTSAPKVRELQQNLDEANEEMQGYRTEVTQHFEQTAHLFNQLTNNYREVYEHLANSSDQLCGDRVVKLKGLTSDSKVLEAESKPVESDAPQEPVVEPEKAEAEPQPQSQQTATAEPEPTEAATSRETTPETEEKQQAAETEASPEAEEKKGNGSSEEPIAAPVTETAAAEKQAGESRTIH